MVCTMECGHVDTLKGDNGMFLTKEITNTEYNSACQSLGMESIPHTTPVKCSRRYTQKGTMECCLLVPGQKEMNFPGQ